MPSRHLALPCALALALLLPASAAAIPPSSHITSPAGPVAYLFGEEGSKVTVAGTAAGTGEVDLRCYFGNAPNSYRLVKESIPVEGGAFSKEVPITSFLPNGPAPLGPCQLRAVPESTGTSLPPGTEDEFEGPLIAASQFLGAAGASNFFGVSATLAGTYSFEDAGRFGLESSLYSTVGHEVERLFYGVLAMNPFSEEGVIGPQVNGTAAYLPSSLSELERTLKEEATKDKETFTPLTGKPAVALANSFNESTRALGVTEEAPLVECSPSNAFPPTVKGCTSLVPAGVTLVRKYLSSNEGHLAVVTERWRSTDGASHMVTARYLMEQFQASEGGSFQFPGEAAFGGVKTGDRKTLPAGAGAIFYKGRAGATEAGNGETPQGAIVYDAPPSEAVNVVTGTDTKGSENDLGMTYVRNVPAGGSSTTLRMAFPQSFSMTEVRSLAATTIASYYPSIAITSPSEGSTSASASVTVSGTATDGVALTSVTVDGKAVTVGAGGAWSTSLPLTAGANTITATATDQSGLSSTATLHVTYPAAATAKLRGGASGSGGHVTFTITCSGVASTTCKVRAVLTTVEELHGRRLLGLSARTRRRTVTVGVLNATIAAGTTKKLAISLNATGRQLLARFHRLPAHLKVVLEGQAGHAAATLIARNITIKPARKHRRRHR
jgi:hypothetical protein